MLIAPVSASMPSSPAADDVVVTRGRSLPSTQDINDPAPRFMRVYSDEMFSLLGLTSLSYSSASPDRISLRFQNYDLAKLADGILKDTVLGARLVMADSDGTAYDMSRPAAGWATYPTNLARAAAALPGVTGYRWFGRDSFLFTTDSTATRVKLQQLVERRFDDTWTAYWKGECFGPGCRPDPKPPTGEI